MQRQTMNGVFFPESTSKLKSFLLSDTEFLHNAARFAFIMGYRTNADLQRFIEAYDEAVRSMRRKTPEFVPNI
jgi:thiaminase